MTSGVGAGYVIPAGTAALSMYVQDLTGHSWWGELTLQLQCPGLCARPCGTFETYIRCTDPSNTLCAWDNTLGVCRDACSINGPAQCNNDPFCMYTPRATSKC